AHKTALAMFNGVYCSGVGTNVEEKNYYIENFTRTTLHGPMNLYRATRLNHDDNIAHVGETFKVPVLRIIVEKDPIVTPSVIESFPTDWIDKIEDVRISEGGHNVHTENPDALNKILTDYLEKFFNYVDESKDGIPVVLVHGFPDLWYSWRYQIDYLVSLGHYRVVALDLLGYGGSDKPRCENLTERHPSYTSKIVAGH
ncbi:hypothetical protein BGX27_002862, partial [Mortierella sp. AM989]